MRRMTVLTIALLGSAAATLTGYAAARSCAEANAETVELELVEVTHDGSPVADLSAYGTPTVKVFSTKSTVRLYAKTSTKHVWSEEYAR